MIKSGASELTNLLISLMQLIGKRHLGHGIVKPSQKWASGLIHWAGCGRAGGRMEEGTCVDVTVVTL